MRNTPRVPTLIGLLLLITSIAAGVLLVQQKIIFRLAASVEQQPQDVRITNITDTNFTVSWVTEKPTLGAIIYGSSSSLGETSQEINTTSTTHHITLSNLKPKTKHYFKILSDGIQYGKEGAQGSAWTQLTGVVLSTKASSILSGTVTTTSGNPVNRALVYITLPNAAPLSSITDRSGAFTVLLSTMRATNLGSYAQYNKTSVLSIFVQTGINQNQDCCASAQVAISNTRPMPPLVLGETRDFRNLERDQEIVSPPQSNIIINSIQTQTGSLRKTSGFTPLKTQTTATSLPTTTTNLASTFFSPSPSPTVKPLPTPAPTTKSTNEIEIPTSGNLTITAILLILGLGLLFTGLFVLRTNNA